MSIKDRVRIEEIKILSDNWYILKKAVFSWRRKDGTWQQQSREVYDRGHGATILLYDPVRQTVILTRQFRFPMFHDGYDDLLIEAPAGLLDNAAPEDRIRAETEEETGYRVQDVTKIFESYMSPGSVTEKLHFFTGVYSPTDKIGDGGGQEEEGEDIDVLEVSFSEAMSMMAHGKILDAKTIMLLQYAALRIFKD